MELIQIEDTARSVHYADLPYNLNLIGYEFGDCHANYNDQVIARPTNSDNVRLSIYVWDGPMCCEVDIPMQWADFLAEIDKNQARRFAMKERL